MDEDQRVLEGNLHRLGVCDEIGRKVAAVELHSLDGVERGLGALGLFDRDDAVFADLVHRLGDKLADDVVVVRGDSADLRDLLGAFHRNGDLAEPVDEVRRCGLEASAKGHRVDTGGDILHALEEDGLGEDCCSSCSVAGDIAGLRGDLFDELSAHILEGVLKLDLFSDRDAVLSYCRASPFFVENYISALRAERYFDGLRELADADL